MFTAAVSPEPQFGKSFCFGGLDNFGAVDVNGRVVGDAGAGAAHFEALLVGPPLVGEHVSAIHTTDGDDHGL